MNHGEFAMYRKNRLSAIQSAVFSMLMILLCTPLLSCGKREVSDNKSGGNLFTYAVTVEDGSFSPKDVPFGATAEKVLEVKGLTADAVEDDLEERSKRIRNQIGIEGLSDEITEIYQFEENRLITVMYVILVEQSEFEQCCELLQQQAAEHMPDELRLTAGDQRLEQNATIIWKDKNQNTIYLSSPIVDTDGKKTIILSLHAANGK